MEFKSPLLLLFVVIIPALMYFLIRKRQDSTFRFPSTDLLLGLKTSFKEKFFRIPVYFRWAAMILLLLSLAGPRKVLEQTIITTEGVDIMLALDVSGSMAAEDFQINGKRQSRLDIIKGVVKEFIDKRVSDRIGLVIFGGRAYAVCPLTTDYTWLKSNLSRVKLGLIEDGTAIGSGVLSSLLRLKDSKAKSRILILLTDGVNNAGKIDPATAGTLAKTFGVKVYTIGAGSQGLAPMPVNMFGQMVYQQVPVEIDEVTLKQIAQSTGGKYFRATDTDSLRGIYQEIDLMEKTKIDKKGYRQYQELFWILVSLALGLWLLAIILENTLFFKIP